MTSCAGTNSSCPPIVEYTPEEQEQAAWELDVYSGGAEPIISTKVIPRMMGDYMVLRDQIRACRGE